jgi:lipid-A-disaccharide synthase
MMVAGEPSGDRRAAELLRELSGLSDAAAFGLGGDLMAAEGFEAVHHLSEYSVMGFYEVAAALPRILRLERSLRREALGRRPDAVVLVDYPGFNMRFARWAARQGFPVIYYISPQLWAWGSGRVRKVRRCVDLMITLFRFEAEFYRSRGVRASWAGHPLVDAIPAPDSGTAPGGHLALLPGSREQEVSRLAPGMRGALETLLERGAVPGGAVAVSGHVPEGSYAGLTEMEGVRACSSVGEALRGAAAALVCSGTATLECALHGVPFAITYRTSPPTYLIARALVRRLDCIGMPNLVAGRRVVAELIQSDATPGAMADAAGPLCSPGLRRKECLQGLEEVREALGPPGAARRAAQAVLEELERHGG